MKNKQRKKISNGNVYNQHFILWGNMILFEFQAAMNGNNATTVNFRHRD